MVMNYARFLSGEFDYVQDELTGIAAAAHERGALLKVIFENHYLTPTRSDTPAASRKPPGRIL